MFSRVTKLTFSLKRILLDEIKENECSSAFPCLMSSWLLGYNPETTSFIHDLLTLFSLSKIFLKVKESPEGKPSAWLRFLLHLKWCGWYQFFIPWDFISQWGDPYLNLAPHLQSLEDQPKFKDSKQASVHPRLKDRNEAVGWQRAVWGKKRHSGFSWGRGGQAQLM